MDDDEVWDCKAAMKGSFMTLLYSRDQALLLFCNKLPKETGQHKPTEIRSGDCIVCALVFHDDDDAKIRLLNIILRTVFRTSD